MAFSNSFVLNDMVSQYQIISFKIIHQNKFFKIRFLSDVGEISCIKSTRFNLNLPIKNNCKVVHEILMMCHTYAKLCSNSL